jgi:general L-amino acid transport system substrate-binding protein
LKKIGLAAAFCLPIVAAAFASGLASTAHAGAIIDRIRTGGVIRCGGVSRPGLVGQSPDGRVAAGLYLDLCRAIGAALLGPEGRIEFRPYDSDRAFDRVRDGTDDLSFLDGSEILGQGLAGRTTLGPPVVFVSTAAMVPGDSAVPSLADLAGKTICFYQGSNAHRNLEAWMAAHRLDFRRMGLMEYGELYDTYNARVCDAQVGEIGDLAVARLDEADARLKSRILAEPLATFPILAVTPASDPQWSAIVAWAVYALQRAELPAKPWAASGLESLGFNAADLGLAEDWKTHVVGAAGTYADIYAGNLGDRSRLNLSRGPNAPVEAGGLFVTPYRE